MGADIAEQEDSPTDRQVHPVYPHADLLPTSPRQDKYVEARAAYVASSDPVDFGYANVLGVSEDLGLQGNQYSLLNIILSSAQLAWQPISSYILVRVPPRILMTVLVVCWGSIQTGMAGGTT